MTQASPKRKGLAVTGFIFGIAGMLSFWIPVLGTLLSLIAVITSKAALSWIKHDRYKYGGAALATIGFTLGIIFLLLSVVLLVIVGVIFALGYFAGKVLGN